MRPAVGVSPLILVEQPTMPFTIASYNILAEAYIKPERYPGIPPAILAPQWRRPALVRHIAGLNAQVICLQEAEPDLFATLLAHLQSRGYQGHFAQKTDRPDGCATFVRTDTLPIQAVHAHAYTEGGPHEPASGHVALVVTLRWQDRLVAVANTHLKWHPPGTPPAQQWGLRQITELLARRHVLAPDAAAWVICGDFNVTPDSEVAALLRQEGWIDTYREREHMRTCNTNRRARRIDYLWHTPNLTSRPFPLRAITDDSALPSSEEPSDHIAILASIG
jgi:mRNA deadenylase 3'-5' endonuclease subunit Ccr4